MDEREPIEIPEATESVPCPLCGGTEGFVVGTRARFGLKVRNLCCATCSLVYVSPRPTPQAMARYYRSGYRLHYANTGRLGRHGHGFSPFSEEAQRAVRRTFEQQAALAIGFAATPRGARVLEVGCQRGETLARLRAALEVEAHGVEPSVREAQAASVAGVRCFAGALDAYDPGPLRFDRIQLFHVLEHLHDPLAALLSLRSWLRPEGALLIEVPNACAPYGPLEENFFQNVHLVTFSANTLTALLARAGLVVARCWAGRSLIVLARAAPQASLPLPFERGLLPRPHEDARWMQERLAAYAVVAKLRHLLSSGTPSVERLAALLLALERPLFPGYRAELCADLVARFVGRGALPAARLLLEKVAEIREEPEGLRAALRARAAILSPVER